MTREEIETKIQYHNDIRADHEDVIQRHQKQIDQIDLNLKCLHHMLEIAKLKEDRLPADWVI